MSLLDRVGQFFSIEPMQTRTLSVVSQLPGVIAETRARRPSRQWRGITVAEALSIPAILRAVTLISNVTGALSLDGYRSGARLDAAARPRLIVRPNPLSTPREFFRDSAWNMATRGEAWWWVARRDVDGMASALWPVNPVEVQMERNDKDERYPTIRWRGKVMPNEDMVQITLVRDAGSLRGIGPLQLCGAAVNVAVEAQEWAANFYALGGFPNVTMHDTTGQLSEAEMQQFKDRWTDRAPNTPFAYSGEMELAQFDPNESGAQMLEARLHQNGEVALMFGVPGTLLEHGISGSASIAYQNVAGEFDKFVRGCLWPNYLEGIEQAMSDLLTRSTVARFNVDALLRPDKATRYNIYKTGQDAGLPWVTDMAAQEEGIEPGDIERAPIPFAEPAAIPPPIQIRSRAVRCEKCDRLLADLATPPYKFTCPRCKTAVAA